MAIPETFPNETAVLFATGPSLTKEQVDLVRPYHEKGLLKAFGCNDSYTIVDYLDVLYACDKPWWDHHKEEVFKTNIPELWTQEALLAKNFDKIKYTPGKYADGLSLNPNIIHYGSNSGFQLLNLAYLMGIRKFILLGYNMGAGGVQHFFGIHPPALRRASPFEKFVQAFNKVQNEIAENIINCTEPTAITKFKKMPLEKALKTLEVQDGS